ncbi:T9SS type A sorting domain-containing protein [Aquimarina sp. 2201CG1-2-11]|uniref:T9SS type A sorting domain-containing protein n=1 Tax=Aquimarina discodermiae TaxID=3231043 RepID=UPI003461F877
MKILLSYSKLLVLGIAILCTISFTNAQQSQAKPSKKQTLKNQQVFSSDQGSIDYRNIVLKREDAIERAKFEFERLKDPSGKIPQGIRQAEIEFSRKIAIGDDAEKSLQRASKSSKGSSFSYWKNRGPGNVGGRTRAVAIDRNNENVILAGGVSGGLCRSKDGGRTWRKVTRRFQNPSVTAIVQDPRPGKGSTWYYGSGERVEAGVSAEGALFQGNGIFKSQDGGRTWRELKATINQDIGAFDSAFDFINDLVINPTNGDLFVATFSGLFRSQDGGNTFEEVLQTGPDSFVEVSITSTGILYASTFYNAAPNAGFFTSNNNGETWTNITPPNFIQFYGRSKIGIDHSNEDVVYFFTVNLNFTMDPAVLYRYDASATTPEETWVDLTENLPFNLFVNFGLGILNLQGGYNMVCEVHPTQSNIVFVGGTCLYRSTTGFTTLAGAESWIGGNGPGELDILLNTIGRGAAYTNQHADQHALVFFPSNPNKAIAGHDGGLSLTEDITVVNEKAEQVTWESLNNNYITTHSYHVAFDPQSDNENLLAGFQDNGTWFTNSTNPNDDWDEQLGADGGYSAIADNGRTHYVSVQNGIIRRLNLDEEGNRVSFTTVHPASANGFAFVNPFVLDPNNDNVMYALAGNTIWRNHNLDEVPLSSLEPTEVNWVNLKTSTVTEGMVTALDLSKFPVANRLYYGTNQGQVFRMDNANVDGQPAVDLTTGKGLPVGYINDINVDPSNSDHVIVTFSNYGIPSIFVTDNAGETWTNISGNLEENPDGSGNGPSVRSTAFFGSSHDGFEARLQKVYAATSTGLYYAMRLNGENTVWRKENFRIGNAVTDEVAVRKDGFIAIASGGSGIFSARFPIFNELPEPTLSVAFPLDDFVILKNSEDTKINITGLFVQSEGLPIDIEVTNTNPELVTATLEGDILTLSYASDTIGEVSIGFIATSGEEQVSEGFTVKIEETSIYEQINPEVTNIRSQNFVDFGAITQSADDFVVPEGNIWNINRILAFGNARGNPIFNSATVVIYTNNDGVPGDEVYNSGELAPTSDLNDSNLNITLPEVVTLKSGKYWISVYANLAFSSFGNLWFWSSQDNTVGNETQFIDPFNLFLTGAIDWTAASVALIEIPSPMDQRFQIFGDVTGSDEVKTGATAIQLASVKAFRSATVHPNPSQDQFVFNFGLNDLPKSGGKTTVKIYNSVGRLVQVNSDVNLRDGFVWDASNFASGFYFAKFSGDMTGVIKLSKQ